MIHSFLMIGQSNMAGRGFAGDVPQIYDEHIKMQRNGVWHNMFEPINYDLPSAGIGLGASFAASWRFDNMQNEIGLIPCAEGGSNLDDWAIGGALFDNAVSQAQLAQRTSELKGILWHQGENDCSPENAQRYCEKFAVIINELRRVLHIREVPLILGGLGDYLSEGLFGKYFSAYPLINEALEKFVQTNENCYFVTAKELTANPDGLHFNARSQRLFGVRYYDAYHHLRNIFEPLADEEVSLTRIYDRPHTKEEEIKLLEHNFAIGNMGSEDYLRHLEVLKSN